MSRARSVQVIRAGKSWLALPLGFAELEADGITVGAVGENPRRYCSKFSIGPRGVTGREAGAAHREQDLCTQIGLSASSRAWAISS